MSEAVEPGSAMAPEPEVIEDPEPATMTLVDHLSELRRRIAISIVAVGIGAVIGFLLAEPIIELLLTPLPGGEVVFLTVGGGFFVFLRVALIVGILLALPVILYQLWAFVAPGLLPEERRAALPWIPMTVIFFLIGTAVAWITLPYAVGFLIGFEIDGSLTALPSAEAYFSFVTIMFLLFGLVMQFPIVLIFLDRLGVLNVDQLRSMRRYVLLGVVIFAVVVTPGGDPISPIVLSGTMYLLYEFTIFLMQRRRQERGSDV
ncbi:MAG: twin-arginine translocase subunit TatC [Candidatus Limnocylindrales bacterium]